MGFFKSGRELSNEETTTVLKRYWEKGSNGLWSSREVTKKEKVELDHWRMTRWLNYISGGEGSSDV